MTTLHAAAPGTALPAGTFSAGHILLTASLTAVLALAVGALLKARGLDLMALAVLSFTATWLLRRSANMPALNDDGLPGFSANDCLAPVVTWVTVTLYIDLRGQSPGAALRRPRGASRRRVWAVLCLCWACWPSCWCYTSSTAGRDRRQVSPVRVSGPVAAAAADPHV